ncbi:hypothetical protein EB118_22450 [bacterium]|nr:hypothetical protein [bacterium]NDG32817.1 hypothetical protein [bacterium]
MHNKNMEFVTTGNMPATPDNTTVYYDARDEKIASLELRLQSLEDDFTKLTAFVNNIANKS